MFKHTVKVWCLPNLGDEEEYENLFEEILSVL